MDKLDRYIDYHFFYFFEHLSPQITDTKVICRSNNKMHMYVNVSSAEQKTKILLKDKRAKEVMHFRIRYDSYRAIVQCMTQIQIYMKINGK